jgi:Tfp pilus assembly protein PilF/V8-like Glu-specific endopeptidase
MKFAGICGIICLQMLALVDRTIALPLSEVAKIVEPITVLINNSNTSQGTGVIIGHQGKQYTILTAAHVLCGKDYYNSCDRNSTYTINIGDRQYSANFSNIKLLPERLDLALVRFNSDRTYPVAKIGNSSQLTIGMTAFVAGFPVPTIAIERSLFITHEGKIVAVASSDRRINKNGYGTIYNTTTLPGMSGGGVFNDRGELIAIHGQGDRDPETGNKTGNNLGIPIASFVRLASKVGIDTANNKIAIAAPKTADDYLITGVSKYYDGNKQGSLIDFSKAIQLDTKSALAFYQRGFIRNSLGLKQAALTDLSRAIELEPKYTKAYYQRGTIRAEANDRNGAVSDFDRTIALDPKYQKAYVRRGMIRDKLGDFAGAVSDYTVAIELDAKPAQLYYLRGLARYNSGNKQAAIADYDRAIALNRNYAVCYYQRGIARNALQDKSGAKNDLLRAAKLFQKLGNTVLYNEVNSLLEQMQ